MFVSCIYIVYAALLLPADHPRDSCLAALRQPGLDLLSQEFTAPPREETKTVEKRDVGKKFGWAYKELKGKGKPTQIRIPKPLEHSCGGDKKKAMLKRVKVVHKVDCWLTFKEYQKFARYVTTCNVACIIQHRYMFLRVHMHIQCSTGILLQGLVLITNITDYLTTMHFGQVPLQRNFASGFQVKP